ncbi:hypothetical protein JNUCC31_00100 [Paenibacillus sp. JNUCC31]|uniref:beta-galactosidase small subunit n=1 Tax=Paenibacillus sp. JNUCC-31 TaxID=2777983 RepID=UPI001782D456|nr:hypothetical protein JNUCC31_00100 [Paenibacillus sp. JNUCC-31]
MEDAATVTVQGDVFLARFDKREGTLTTYERYGKTLLLSGAQENFYRAPTGIDQGQGGSAFYAGEWETYGLNRLVREVISVRFSQPSDNMVLFETEAFLHGAERSDGFKSQVRYLINGDGSIEVQNRVNANVSLSLLPRIGLTFTMPMDNDQLQWYGCGPHESYVDRKRSASIGLYRTVVDEEPCPYIVPVEWGGKEEVRWFSLTDSDGSGLMFSGFEPFHMDAHRNSVLDYAAARHIEELPERDRIWVNIDHIHSGLGGDDGWSRNIHEEFQVKPGYYEYSFVIKPMGLEKTD